MPDIFKKTFYLPRGIPVFTGLVIFLCCAFFVLHHLALESSPAWIGSWGYFSVWDIYSNRQVWGLLTCSWVHHEPMHLFFNLYWVWILGRVLEEELGTLNTLFFWISSAVVASACQLAFGESTGIGASGVVYAIFGYELAARHQVERFSEVLSSGNIRLFLIWLFACLFLDWTGLMNIGNGAHFGGFCFGFILGYLVMAQARLSLGLGVAGVLVAIAVASGFYAPWNSWWCSTEGFRQLENNPKAAITWFDRVSPKSSIYPYTLYTRSIAEREIGDPAAAMSDQEKALQFSKETEERGTILNDLAWAYATESDSKLRDGAKAVGYAREACDLTEWKDAANLDTLAAAYAEAGNFPEAVKWQIKTLEIVKKERDPDNLKEYEDRLSLYRNGKPYRNKN